MQQIIYFLKKQLSIAVLLLMSISLMLTIQSHSYHRSEYINSANALSGYTYTQISSIKEYFGLRAKMKN